MKIIDKSFIDKSDIERELIATDDSLTIKDKYGLEKNNWEFFYKIEEYQDMVIIHSKLLTIITIPVNALNHNRDLYDFIKMKINKTQVDIS